VNSREQFGLKMKVETKFLFTIFLAILQNTTKRSVSGKRHLFRGKWHLAFVFSKP